jgi:lipoprotein-anchoring transpeptidase ErfK/SrfK
MQTHSLANTFGALCCLAGLLSMAPDAALGRSISASLPALPKMGPSFRESVSVAFNQEPGTVIVVRSDKALYLVTGPRTAFRYRISVGREGFGWSGTVTVGAKKEWPEWRPPAEMRLRQPALPSFVPAGPYNPLGARALYLHRGGRDTLFRIHGTNDPTGVGFDGTSGCIRLTNTDVMDLYKRVSVGSKVVVQ